MKRSMIVGACLVLVCGCAHEGPSPLLALRRVVLNQSGSGYFERTGRVEGDQLSLRLRSHEVNDVLATLTVLEQGPNPRQTTVAAGVPHAPGQGAREHTAVLDLRLPDARPRELLVAYAVPTANWRATYRVVLPDQAGSPALLQLWALVHNSSDEDWRQVQLTLATGAPLSFAFNLRQPSYSSRPDATGRLAEPVVNAPVVSEETRQELLHRNSRGDVTVEGGEPTSGDGYEDTDGEQDGSRWWSPVTDSDHDGIRDEDDRCPSQAEVHNGLDDGDGCPDVAPVRVAAQTVQVLERLLFDANGAAVLPRHQAQLQAVRGALLAHPALRVEVQGHASSEESDPWSLGLHRAAAVRARLVALGVPAERLTARSYASARPRGAESTPEGRAQNRAVSFEVAAEGENREGTTPSGPMTVANLSARDNATTHESQGDTRFEVAEPVTIRAGSAALVTIASRQIPGEDVYLYRPEPAAPSSRRHPYRAARLRNNTGLTLLPGPVALFAGGTFAGEGLLQRLNVDENTFVPYAIDPSTTVTAREEDLREPHRVLSVLRNVVTLEDTQVRRTVYRVEPGARSLPRLFVRNVRLPGYSARALPAESEPGRDADLVPVVLSPRQEATLTLEQTAPARRTLSLLEDCTTDLAPYLQGSPEATRQALRAVLDQRAALARAEREANELREALGDVASRNAELRETLAALQRATDAPRVALRTSFTRQLQESMTRHGALSRDLSARTAQASALRTQLADALRTLRIDPEPAAPPSR